MVGLVFGSATMQTFMFYNLSSQRASNFFYNCQDKFQNGRLSWPRGQETGIPALFTHRSQAKPDIMGQACNWVSHYIIVFIIVIKGTVLSQE